MCALIAFQYAPGPLAFDWRPWRALKLTASLHRDEHNSREPAFNDRSDTVGPSALASF